MFTPQMACPVCTVNFINDTPAHQHTHTHTHTHKQTNTESYIKGK